MATRNYVPRANGEGSIGTEKKHWGGAFFDNLAVKTLEVIGGGAENDAQPATVGWVKQSFGNLLKHAFEAAGVRYNLGETGYVCFGTMISGLTLQWGVKDVNIGWQEDEKGMFVDTVLPVSMDILAAPWCVHRPSNIDHLLLIFVDGIIEQSKIRFRRTPIKGSGAFGQFFYFVIGRIATN